MRRCKLVSALQWDWTLFVHSSRLYFFSRYGSILGATPRRILPMAAGDGLVDLLLFLVTIRNESRSYNRKAGMRLTLALPPDARN